MPSPFCLRVLGGLRLEGRDGDLLVGRRKELALLAYLSRKASHSVPRAQLAALFWGERDNAKAHHSLRTALLNIRRAVGDALEVRPESARVADQAIEVDATVFEREVSTGRLAEAVARWHGDFLEGLEDVGSEGWNAWLEGEREGLRQRLAWAMERLCDAAAARGEWSEGLRWAERWSAALPLDERATGRVIEALRLAGRTDEALARHAQFTAQYTAVHARQPSPEFVRLPERVRKDGELARAASIRRRGETGSAALLAPDLVGRSDEFAALVEAFATVEGGRGAVVLVEGDEGMGKTRLGEEFVRWVHSSSPDATVLASRAFDAERDWRWTAGRHLFANLVDAPGIAASPPECLSRLGGTLAPALRERFRSLPSATAGELSNVPVAEALVRALGDVADEEPVVLFLDDFSAADEETQAVLRALIRRPPRGVLQLYTVRPESLERLRLGGDLRGGGATRVTLSALSVGDVDAMIASMLAMDPPERRQLAERLHAEGGGNPLYIVELIASLVEAEQLIIFPDGVWRTATPASSNGKAEQHPSALPMPAGVREAALSRIERLSTTARAVLDAAAVLGGPSDVTLLTMTAGLTPSDASSALDELVSHRFLRETEQEGTYEFSIELRRRVAYEAIPRDRRRRMHLAAVGALSAVSGNGGAELGAYHRRAAAALAPVGDRRPARRWLKARSVVVAVVAGAVVAASGALRAWKGADSRADPPVPNLLAVLPFAVEDDTAHAYLGDGLAQLLSVNLEGMGPLHTVDPGPLISAAPRAPADRANVANGRRLARQFGAELYVVGRLVENDSGRLSAIATLYDDRGATLAVAQAKAGGYDDVASLADTLTRQLVASRYARPNEELSRLATRTTSSQPALREYLMGEQRLREGRYSDAVNAFQRAVAADSNFALAYFRLSIAAEWEALGDVSQAAAARAAQLASRLPERQRLLVAALHAHRRGAAVLADSLYSNLLRAYPYDIEATTQHAELRFHHGYVLCCNGDPLHDHPLREPRRLWEQVLDADSGNRFAVIHLARIAGAQRDSAAAVLRGPAPGAPDVDPYGRSRTLELAAWRAILHRDRVAEDSMRVALSRLGPAAVVIVWQLVTFSRDLEASERFARVLLEPGTAPPIGHLLLAHVQAARGHYRAALAEIDSAAGNSFEWDMVYPAVFSQLPLMPLNAQRLAAQRARVRAWRPPPRDSTNGGLIVPHGDAEPEVREYLLGTLALAAGDVPEAQRMFESLRKSAIAGPPGPGHLSLLFAAELANRLSSTTGQSFPQVPGLRNVVADFSRGLESPFYSQIGRRWSTADWYREHEVFPYAIQHYSTFGITNPYELPYLAPAALRSGEVFEQMGLTREAAGRYAEFIELWRDADPELQRLVADVRQRLGRLRQGARAAGRH